MAENNDSENTGDDNKGDQNTGEDIATRPDYVPEKFWDAAAGAPKLEDWGRDYTDLATRHGKGKDALKAEIEAEMTASIEGRLRPEIETRLKAELGKGKAPESPNDYSLEIAEDSPIKALLTENNMVILTEPPADDFILEQGKNYFVADPADPMMKFWKGFAHEHGLSPEQFQQGVVKYAATQAALQPTEADLQAQREAVFKELGDHGEDRYTFARSKLIGVLGEDAAKLLWPDHATPSKAGIEAMETLLRKAGQPSFSPQMHAMAGKSVEELRAEHSAMMAENDYWTNPVKQARAAEIFRRITQLQSTPKAA